MRFLIALIFLLLHSLIVSLTFFFRAEYNAGGVYSVQKKQKKNLHIPVSFPLHNYLPSLQRAARKEATSWGKPSSNLQPPAGGPHSPAPTAGLVGPENTLRGTAGLGSPEAWHRYDQRPKNSLTSHSALPFSHSAFLISTTVQCFLFLAFGRRVWVPVPAETWERRLYERHCFQHICRSSQQDCHVLRGMWRSPIHFPWCNWSCLYACSIFPKNSRHLLNRETVFKCFIPIYILKGFTEGFVYIHLIYRTFYS